jgi:uncharacterized membrane protein
MKKSQNPSHLQNGIKKLSSLIKLRSKGKEEFPKTSDSFSEQKQHSIEEQEKFQKILKEFKDKHSDSDIKTKQKALFKMLERSELMKPEK